MCMAPPPSSPPSRQARLPRSLPPLLLDPDIPHSAPSPPHHDTGWSLGKLMVTNKKKAHVGPREAPSRSRGGRIKTKSVRRLLDPLPSTSEDSKVVGSIMSDLEVETLSAAMANKLKIEEEENLWNEAIDWNAGIHVEMEPEEEQDMDSDPDIMNDANEV
ncbi:unnamed protein product [Urochloa humidicola]